MLMYIQLLKLTSMPVADITLTLYNRRVRDVEEFINSKPLGLHSTTLDSMGSAYNILLFAFECAVYAYL
jgi:hypothetical protein